MATEQEYDDIIAPMLADVAAKCKDLGMNIIARVEWEPGESGITQIGIGDDAGIGQKMTQLAAHCHGNIDQFFMQANKRFDAGSSMIMHMLNKSA